MRTEDVAFITTGECIRDPFEITTSPQTLRVAVDHTKRSADECHEGRTGDVAA